MVETSGLENRQVARPRGFESHLLRLNFLSMRASFEKGYISVVSPTITYLCGIGNGSPRTTRASAVYPFIFFRSEEEKKPWVITHELIHFQQQIETLFIGSRLINIIEWLYARMFLRMSSEAAYFWRSSEQEAYRNQSDTNYLSTRTLWARFCYFKDKKKIVLGQYGVVSFGE